MGAPPKGVSAAVNARLQKMVILDNTAIFVAHLSECDKYLPVLQCTFDEHCGDRSTKVILRERTRPVDTRLLGSTLGAPSGHAVLFQYLQYTAERATSTASTQVAYSTQCRLTRPPTFASISRAPER